MAVKTEIETYRGVVYPWQMDHMDHMNVQFYTAHIDSEARKAVPFPDDIARLQADFIDARARSG